MLNEHSECFSHAVWMNQSSKAVAGLKSLGLGHGCFLKPLKIIRAGKRQQKITLKNQTRAFQRCSAAPEIESSKIHVSG